MCNVEVICALSLDWLNIYVFEFLQHGHFTMSVSIYWEHQETEVLEGP